MCNDSICQRIQFDTPRQRHGSERRIRPVRQYLVVIPTRDGDSYKMADGYIPHRLRTDILQVAFDYSPSHPKHASQDLSRSLAMPTMPHRPGSMSYDQDDAATHVTTRSERLRSHLREECNKALNRLFPDPGRGDVGDWNKKDVLRLHAIFELARVARHAETANPLLRRHTILRVLNKLATATPFRDVASTSLIELEQHLRLLAVTLRLYKYEKTELGHDLRDELYQGISKLSDKYSEDRRNCPTTLSIERWNVAFLLQHCQYLLTSVDDTYSVGRTAASKFLSLVDGTIASYGGQYLEGRRLARNAVRRQRTRPKWHDEIMRLEDICFAIYARGVGVELLLAAESEEITDLESEERDASWELRDTLEVQLALGSGRHYSVVEGVNNFFGRATQIALESGPYEENAEYFKYGILDLMAELCHRVRNRSACFEEFIGVLNLTLQHTHDSANLIHRKVVDIYRKILDFGEQDQVLYGKVEDRSAIEAWMDSHPNQFEGPEYSTRSPYF